jgi:5-methylcytosine-specific restriction endonuclease McrA
MLQLGDDERRALRQKAREATLDGLRALGGEARRGAVREHALRHGGFTERELAAAAPEAAGGKYATLVEHNLAWALTQLKRDGLVENPRRGVWRLAGAALEPVEPLVGSRAAPDRLVELNTMAYREYLRTPEWRQVRAAALLRAGNACALDTTHTEDLEVHHRTYERRGAELPTDVIVLCRECHRVHHAAFGRPARDAGPEPAPARTPSLLSRLLRRAA